MEINYFINNNKKLKNFYVVNTCKSYSYGFTHITTLFYKDEYTTAKVNYINRTWERYTYETSTKKAMHQLATEFYNEIKSEYKTINNKKRVNDADIKTINKLFDAKYKDFVTLYNTLSDYKKIKKANKIINMY